MTLKKIVLPLLSLFLLYRTVELCRYLFAMEPSSLTNFGSAILAVLLSMFVTGAFAFVGFAYPTNAVLPAAYYSVNNSKLITSIHDWLGVKYFRKMLLLTFWGTKKNRKMFFNGTKAGIENFIHMTKQSEFGHLGALIVLLILSIILLIQKHYLLVSVLTVINVIGNLYPIILQRFHRMRIASVFNK
ncbi:MAG: hypothetical protein NWQ55_04665 [Salibacteraceae bacterium]|nr:hypothetical protein [Salibacteraceae bacterium]